jgi:hypothetical protein
MLSTRAWFFIGYIHLGLVFYNLIDIVTRLLAGRPTVQIPADENYFSLAQIV